MSKREKLGLNSQVEKQCVECLKLATEAAFTPKWQKLPFLQKLRIEIEVTKRLVRLEHELNIITAKNYLELEQKLCDISKSATNWINSLSRKEPA